MSLSRRRMGWSETVALVLAAITCAVGAAAWIADATAALPRDSDIAFDDRFLDPSSPSRPSGRNVVLHPLYRSAFEIKLRDAKAMLAQKLSSHVRGSGVGDAAGNNAAGNNEAQPPVTEDVASATEDKSSSDIPLPRPRPVAANVETTAQADTAPRPDDRTLLQKLSDMLPAKITLASLVPDGGMFRRGPDLAALGYDKLSAVYDISAKTLYLPNGQRLEAHSGLGELMDNPEHVAKPNVGPTPPAVYELKPRETLFHGVRALRMTPVDGSSALGRVGLLTHSYMLGPNGDSNGCVSIKDYDRFLKAYDDGEVNRLVVVPSLSGTVSARVASQS
jgi:hypothetical protein